MLKHIFLSYQLSENLSGYANGERIKISKTNSIAGGDSSNNTRLELPTHFGTHIDFPYHFSESGKNGDSYVAADFIFTEVEFLDISNKKINDFLVKPHHMELENLSENCQFLILKTGFSEKRHSDDYWNANWGLSPELARFLKNNLPKLRAIGFDSMSLSAFKQRPIGRIAHKEFLVKNDILIVEDMDLSAVNEHVTIKRLTVAPLRFAKADGAPVTIIAEIYE